MRDKHIKKCFEEAMGLSLTEKQTAEYFRQQGIKYKDMKRCYNRNYNKGIVSRPYKASRTDKALALIVLTILIIGTLLIGG